MLKKQRPQHADPGRAIERGAKQIRHERAQFKPGQAQGGVRVHVNSRGTQVAVRDPEVLQVGQPIGERPELLQRLDRTGGEMLDLLAARAPTAASGGDERHSLDVDAGALSLRF